MQVTNVTNDDGRRMANLINFLKAGRWDLTGSDAEALVSVKQWVQALAGDMATALSRAGAAPSTNSPKAQPVSPPPTEATGFKIKAMGSMDSPAPTRRKKK